MQHREQYEGVRKHIAEHGGNSLIFPGLKDGNVINYSTISRRLKRILERVDLCDEGIRFHRLRHTFATALIDDKIDAKTVAEMLGHSSVVTTLSFYRTVTSDAKRAAASALAGKFSTKIK